MKGVKALLVCYVNADIGIGHLSRLLALAKKLKEEDRNVIPEFLIFGDLIKLNGLDEFKLHTALTTESFAVTIEEILKINPVDLLIFDLFKNLKINNLDLLFVQLKQRNINLISIDSLIEHRNVLDVIWIPSFSFDCKKYKPCFSVLKSGWDSYLIQKRLRHKSWVPGSKVLILTGGSDKSNLGESLPAQLDQRLARGTHVHWVRGPFSRKPSLPTALRLDWTIHDAPEQLDELVVQSDYVMTVYGVSLFEVIQYGIPAVVFSPYGTKDVSELNALSKEGVAKVEASSELAINGLVELMSNEQLARDFSMKALMKMEVNGCRNLCDEIYKLTGLV